MVKYLQRITIDRIIPAAHSYAKRFVLLFYYSGREFLRDQCATRAAALTYFTMLSLVPLLVLVFVFFKTFGGDSLIEDQIKPLIFTLLSTGTGEVISGSIDSLLSQSRSGALGSVGFVFLVIVSFSLMDQIHFTLNAIWGERKNRPMLQRWIVYWASLTVLPLLVILSISFTAYLGSLQELRELSEQVVPKTYNLVPFILQGLAFLLLYIFLPKARVKFLAALSGAAVASIIWEFVKKGYLFYTSNAISYNVIYGSLAAVPLFMIWLFITWMVILYGAEFAFANQNYRVIRESRKRMNIPRQWFEALGLEIILEAARRFESDGRNLDPDKFAEERSLPGDLVRGAAYKLAASHLLRQIDGEVILSRNPAELTVEDVVEAMRSGAEGDPVFAKHGRLKDLRDFLRNLEKTDREIKREWSIIKLLDHHNGEPSA